MPKVFISYCEGDKKIARNLAFDLKQDGVDVWIDHTRIDGGDNLPERIGDACEWCDTLLLLWSAKAAQSFWVKEEWSTALSLEKRIIPCLLDEAGLPPILKHRLHLNFREYEAGYRDVCRTLKILRKQVENETTAIKPLQKPEGQKPKQKTPTKESDIKATPSTQKKEKAVVHTPREKQVSPIFRSQPTTLSDDDVKAMLKKHGFFDFYWNEEGRGFHHQYKQEVIDGDIVIRDLAFGLIWQQAGSTESMEFYDAKKWIAELNMKGFAGFRDWRLPTLEEAMSLTEPEEKNDGLYIDLIFDATQPWIWTSDLVQGASRAWVVDFSDGYCFNVVFFHYVRAVRTGQSSS